MGDRIAELVERVRALHRDLDNDIRNFQGLSGLHCRFGCGKCCLKPDIEATPLEFLPLAFELYQEGKAADWLKDRNFESDICHAFNAEKEGMGKCTRYVDRGLICRLFGFSARRNKYGKKEIITCQIIKEEQADQYESAAHRIQDDVHIPMATDYYTRLRGIDLILGGEQLPINKAIERALKVVTDYYYYKNQAV